MNENEETEEIQKLHLFPYLLQEQQPCPTVSQFSWTPPRRKIYIFASPNHLN